MKVGSKLWGLNEALPSEDQKFRAGQKAAEKLPQGQKS